MKNFNYSLDFELSENDYLTNLFGVDDKNIQIMEKIHNVEIKYRGNKIKITGTRKSIKDTKDEMFLLFEEAKKGINIDEDKIKETRCMKILEIDPIERADLFFQTKKRKILPRTKNQKKYFELLNSKDIVFAYGPAGTGKTFLAVAKAVASLQQGLVKKIILSRPAVEAGEKLGFLPGDLKEKVDPFLRPIYDALYEMMPYDQVEKKLTNNIIEIAPIAFMRGRTLEDCYIILDEAQNTTKIQMKMFLTRLGKNSKMVVVADTTQIDLVSKTDSGLIDASNKLNNIEDIGFIELNQMDVVRHEVVRKIINAYEENSRN